MNRYKKLLKNSGVFFIANMGSKLATFLLVRFYTGVLTQAEYGTADLLFSTVNLIVPIITLCITEAALRFSIDDRENRPKILTMSCAIALGGNLLLLLAAFLLWGVAPFGGHPLLFCGMSLASSLHLVTTQFTRGIGKTKLFALSGVLHTVLQIGFNILFLLPPLSWGITGYLWASLLANAVTVMIVFFGGRLWEYLTPVFDKAYLKEMLIYSCPLIPNQLCWQLMHSSSRYVIVFVLSEAANGLYAAASKLPTIISVVSHIFFQAWQLSSVDEAKSADKAHFYSKVFTILAMVLTCGTSFCFVILQPLYGVFVDASYYEGWRCTPYLFIGVLFSCYSGFIGTNYVAMKKTKGAFFTTVVGAVLNIVLNLVLVPLCGIIGSAIATAVAYAVTWLVRAWDTRKFVTVHYGVRDFILPTVLLCTQATLLTLNVTSWIPQAVVFVAIVALYGKDIVALLKQGAGMGKQLLRKKKG
ncbi:MAG: hypothetical protein E7549_05055 [Ruminococcaceae bacterium]|nr:hypothetical protein [Oscillospiraceae bacterium]